MSQRAESLVNSRPNSGGRQSPSKGMTASDKHLSAGASSRYSSICDSGLGSINSTGTESLRRSYVTEDVDSQLNGRLQSACSVSDCGYYSEERCTSHSSSVSKEVTLPTDFAPDADGDTPLHIAVILGVHSRVSQLLSSGRLFRQQLDCRNDLQQTALHLAVGSKQPAVVRELLAAGADPMCRDWRGNTPAHIACRDGEAGSLDALVEALLSAAALAASSTSSPRSPWWQQQRLALDVHNYDGLAPLHLAAAGGHLTLVRRLVESRLADVNYQEAKAGRTLLHLAAESNDVPLARLALELGAEPNVCSYNGVRPAAVAKAWRHVEVFTMLRDCEDDTASASRSSQSSSSAEGDGGSNSEEEMECSDEYDDIQINGLPVPLKAL